MKSSTITTPVLSVAPIFLLLFGVVSSDCPTRVSAQSLVPSDVKNDTPGQIIKPGRMPSCRRSVGDSKSQLHKARMRLRELLHELQREKARDERLAAAKLRSRSSGTLPHLTAKNA